MKKRLNRLYNAFFGRIPSRRVRRFLLRRILGEYGTNSFVGLRTQLMNAEGIRLRDRAVVNNDCHLDGRGGILLIGEDADIGPYTHIWTLQHDPDCPDHGTKGGDVTIGDHVWIASRVTILPGVTVGRGAVVACGSVVTKDVPENAIVAGVPAKVIGQRKNPLTYQLNHNPRFR